MKVILRDLAESDAYVSYHWRNEPAIWKFTGSKPSHYVTLDEELSWIKEVLARDNESRYAICVGNNQEYIGNVQFTHITSEDAEFHIFIGRIGLHGMGVGTKATSLALQLAKDSLGLSQVYLYVNQKNLSAIRVYEKCGFKIIDNNQEVINYKMRLIF